MAGVSKGKFSERFREAAKKLGSALCVGLDPDVKLLPSGRDVIEFNKMVVESTAGIAVAYKPNLALYESMGEEDDKFAGLVALEKTISYIRNASPDALIIADAKRGDIGPCATAYGIRFCDQYDFDAVTAHPYMGHDSIGPLLRDDNKGVFVLCRTSNPSAREFQDLMVTHPESDEPPKPQYQYVAEIARGWNEHGNVGLVVGATYPKEIQRVRQVCEDMFFLIPGVGHQGGDLRAAVVAAADASGQGFTISSSRQIMYAARGNGDGLMRNSEGSARIRETATRLRDEINSALAQDPTK